MGIRGVFQKLVDGVKVKEALRVREVEVLPDGKKVRALLRLLSLLICFFLPSFLPSFILLSLLLLQNSL